MLITTLKKLEAVVARSLVDDFESWSWEHPGVTWDQHVNRLATAYSLVAAEGKPVNRAASMIFATCKKAWLKGQGEAVGCRSKLRAGITQWI